MLPPLSDKQFKELVPEWAQALKQKRCPLVVGLPVYDVIYGPLYGKERGVVTSVSACNDFCLVSRDHYPGGHVLVMFANGGLCSSLATAWVPDMETPEGKAHVNLWLKSIGEDFADHEKVECDD